MLQYLNIAKDDMYVDIVTAGEARWSFGLLQELKNEKAVIAMS